MKIPRIGLDIPKHVFQGGKNDANDAEAICEAVSWPKCGSFAVKSEQQQAVLM